MTIAEIRREIYTRQKGQCLWCGKLLGWRQAHLHEKLERSKGGKISLQNSIILCYGCHIDKAHGNRKPQFKGKQCTKKT